MIVVVYEKIGNEIEETFNYYNVVMDNIENEIYMSPTNYLIARNISIIYGAIKYARDNIDRWYQMIQDKRKMRVVMVHNNLKLEHYIKGDRPYLISWEKAVIDSPIFDIITLFKNHYLDFEFVDILKIYLSKYPLSREEMTLFLTIISIPDKITYVNSEYLTVLRVRRIIDYIYKSQELVKEYGVKQETDEGKKFTK